MADYAEGAAISGLRCDQINMLGRLIPPLWLDAPAKITMQFEYVASMAI